MSSNKRAAQYALSNLNFLSQLLDYAWPSSCGGCRCITPLRTLSAPCTFPKQYCPTKQSKVLTCFGDKWGMRQAGTVGLVWTLDEADLSVR